MMAETFDGCGVCGASDTGPGRYCSHCGTALYLICPRCGQRNARLSESCSACQEPLENVGETGSPRPELVDGRPLERRQLTIMFTDLVDSTGLADSMDPEDFRALIEAHRTIAVAPILRYGGVVARYLGDGMLVLFGYPEAHEDDPERAVRAGLEVASATEAMNTRWVGEGKGRIAVRIGVHTGIVVVGDVLKADVQEIMAVFGNTPSIAARLQALAQPNSVVVSGATKELLPPAILCETRGNTTLKGVRRPVEIFSAVQVRGGQVDRRSGRRVLPFVNREKELAVIRQCWASARRGEGRCLVIEGDPGIGKSRLIRAVEERIVTQPSRWLLTRTSPYATNTDFFAFSELFRHVLTTDQQAETGASKTFTQLKRILKKQGIADSEVVLGLASLLSINIPKKAIATPLQPERARELTLRAIIAWLQHEASLQPLVLVIEDLHWADASTLEAIERLKEDLSSHCVLLIGTTRGATRTSSTSGAVDKAAVRCLTVAQSDNAGSPVAKIAAQSGAFAEASPVGSVNAKVELEKLGAAHAEDLLGHVLQGVELPRASVTTLLERANGVPLYLEELPKPVMEAGDGDAASIALPATLRDSLMAQLDGMGEAKAVAQTAAVLGHSFERSLLEQVWEGEKWSLELGLTDLADATLLHREGDLKTETYGFRHALLAEIAYDSLLRDERRRIHRKTADILARHFRPLSETRPELLARHHEAAGNHDDAFECWLKAGKASARRSANAEAMEHFKNAERVLGMKGNENGQELNAPSLNLNIARAPVLIALRGWSSPDVEAAYYAALNNTDDGDLIFNIQRGLCNVFQLRGDLARAGALAEQLHSVAEAANDRDKLLETNRIVGLNSFLAADFPRARESLLAAIRLYEPDRHAQLAYVHGTHPAVVAHSLLAWTECFLGNPKVAQEASERALKIAESSNHPFSKAYALCLGASLTQVRGDVQATLDRSEQAKDLSEEHGFAYWKAWSGLTEGWARSSLGSIGTGGEILKRSLAAYCADGSAQMYGYGLYLLADAYCQAGKNVEAKNYAESAISHASRGGVRFFVADAYRLLGEATQCLDVGNTRVGEIALIRSLKEARQRKMPIQQLCSSVTLYQKTKRRRLAQLARADAQATLRMLHDSCEEPEVRRLADLLSKADEAP